MHTDTLRANHGKVGENKVQLNPINDAMQRSKIEQKTLEINDYQSERKRFVSRGKDLTKNRMTSGRQT